MTGKSRQPEQNDDVNSIMWGAGASVIIAGLCLLGALSTEALQTSMQDWTRRTVHIMRDCNMKKVVLCGVFLIAGFLLYSLLSIAQLRLRNTVYEYIWVIGPIFVVIGLIFGYIGLRKESIMPVVASAFSFTPLLLALLGFTPLIGFAFCLYGLPVFWGLGFVL